MIFRLALLVPMLLLSIGVSGEPVPDLGARIDALSSAEMNDPGARLPGLVVGVYLDGAPLYVKALGYADVGKPTPLTAHASFALGSTTKLFTTTAILMLAERGKIDLDAPLSRYLPATPHAGEVTIRMLLGLRSGYPEIENQVPMVGNPQAGIDRALATLAKNPLEFPPGSGFDYIQTNYVLLGRTIEAVTGRRYEDFVREAILEPLGLRDASFSDAGGATFPRSYRDGGRAFVPLKPTPIGWGYASGGLRDSVMDVARFDDALLHGKLISPASFAQLSADTIGWGVTDTVLGNQKLVWSFGLWSGQTTFNFMNPQSGVVIVAATNGASVRNFAKFLAQIDRAVEPQTFGDTSASGEDPAVTALLAGQLQSIGAHALDRSLYTPDASLRMNDLIVTILYNEIFAAGGLDRLLYLRRDADGDVTRYWYRARLMLGDAMCAIATDGNGHITDLFFSPE